MVYPGGSPYLRMNGRKIANLLQVNTGCLNHNTSMKNCKFSLLTRSPSTHKETFSKSLTDHLNNTRYQIMTKCWKNDPDARPTFTELKNQLKDMENLHEVRILINMKVSFHEGPTGLGLVIFMKFGSHFLVMSLKLTLQEKQQRSELECLSDNWYFVAI